MCSDCLDEFQELLDGIVDRHFSEEEQYEVGRQIGGALHAFLRDRYHVEDCAEDDEWSGVDDE